VQYVSDGSESSVVPFESENFAAREAFRPAYDRLAQVLCTVLDFTTAIDVGSGQGFLVDALLAQGIDVQAIEASPAALEYASPQAAERTAIGNALWANASRPFGLVCCVEVAEHIEPQHSRTLVNKLCQMATGPVFFTAATPYQPGHGHINCRPTTDWVYFFAQNGWILDIERTIDIRARLGVLAEAPWISTNSMLFTKE
jgi:cyclopropane fatty-acyl-phospholipid synthase-like methyltransferase